MSYIEYDPTNPDLFDNYVPASQMRKKRIIKGIVVASLACLVIYLIYKESDSEKERDLHIS